MKKFLFVIALILLPLWQPIAAQSLLGSWTGGFWLDGNWVAVDVRFMRENENTIGVADVVFPSYANSVAARNAQLTRLSSEASKLEFDISFGDEKIVFRGRELGETIFGRVEYAAASGDFGLTRVVYPNPQTLEKYYGIYRVSPDRFISIFRGLENPGTLGYLDYGTGQIGMLWRSAVAKNEFFSGGGRRVSFPVALRVSFGEKAAGEIKSLSWQPVGDKTNLTARKVEVREERLIFKNGNVTLGGTLISPAARERHPVVIVTPGDFGSNRNSLRLFAHNFVSRGIAALVFDSRGAGESTGTINSSSFPDLADDVLAIVGALKTRKDIDPKKIGLFGFSNSAWTVALAASQSKDVSFLILQSFIGVEPWKQDIYRALTQLRADNFPESTLAEAADFMQLKFEVARTGEGWEKLQAIMEKSRGERWLSYTNMSRSPERLRQIYQTSMTYDPLPALENIKIPVLAYWGENDGYVPVTESVTVFERAMTKTGNKDYTVIIYPRGRHDLVEGDKSPSTGARFQNFPAGFWKMHTDWLLKRLKAGK
jgi:pimeloyl-ACP methyl ester carboxylesterase